ncbi:MAG: restriction endonuclease subunit S [Ruminococcus sp.]|nr:restriction endonuclease subunit S [Ruminococcus sp.]
MINNENKPEIRIEGFQDTWNKHKLSEVANVYDGVHQTPQYTDSGVMFLSVENISTLKSKKYISEEAFERDFKVFPAKGDVLMTRIGDVGTTNVVETDDKMAFYVSLALLKPINVESYFLSNVIKSPLFKKGLKERTLTTAIPQKINKDEIGKVEVVVPDSFEEQEQIGKYFRWYDELIKLHQREVDRLVRVRKAMIDKMFPQNGNNVPAVRFEGFDAPWVLKPFSEIFTERHIIDTISDEYPQLSFTIEEGVIRPEDKKTNKRDFLILDKANKKYLQTEYDDIIYNPANVIYGAIHRNALGKGCVSPIYKIFSTDQDSMFMECIVRHPRFIKEISKSMEGTVKKLRTLKPKAFLEMSAYIAPTIDEQKKIAEYFCKMDRLIEIEKEELEKLMHIKSACTGKMFV